MLTKESYAAREKQESVLATEALQRAFENIKINVHTSTLEREKLLYPILQEKMSLDYNTQLMRIQTQHLKAFIDYSTSYATGLTSSEIKLRKFSEAYQEDLLKARDTIIQEYGCLLRSRTYLYRPQEGLVMQTRETVEAELKALYQHLMSDILPHYQIWIFPYTIIEAQKCLVKINKDLNKNNERYNKLLDEQETIVTDYQNKYTEPRRRVSEILDEESRSIKNAQIIYNMCKQDSVEDLKVFLDQYGGHKEYIEEYAPEALHHSCAANKLDMVHFLLMLGIKQKKDRYGYYPLHYACIHEDEYKTALMLDLLMRYNANVENSIGPSYSTPLHVAACCGNKIAINYFMSYDLNLNINDMAIKRCKDGYRKASNTPLHCAVIEGDLNMVSYLMQLGANPLLKNHRGLSSYEEAEERSYIEIVEYFNNQGFTSESLKVEQERRCCDCSCLFAYNKKRKSSVSPEQEKQRLKK